MYRTILNRIKEETWIVEDRELVRLSRVCDILCITYARLYNFLNRHNMTIYKVNDVNMVEIDDELVKIIIWIYLKRDMEKDRVNMVKNFEKWKTGNTEDDETNETNETNEGDD